MSKRRPANGSGAVPMPVVDDAPAMDEKIYVDLDALTFGDLEMIEGWQSGVVPLKQVLDVLDKAVAGGVRSRPISQIGAVTRAIQEAVMGAQDPNA